MYEAGKGGGLWVLGVVGTGGSVYFANSVRAKRKSRSQHHFYTKT